MSFTIFTTVTIVLAIGHIANGANILAMLGTDMNSHFKALSRVLEYLAPYHNITFFVDSRFKYRYPNITTVSTSGFIANSDLR